MGEPRCLLCKHLGCSRAGREAATEKPPTSAGSRLGRTGRLRARPGRYLHEEEGPPPRGSSVKLRLLCSQVLKELLGQGIDYEKVLKLTADARFESGDVKAMVAVLSFILSSAAKHSVDGESLSSELQQLGLPKEHAACLCRCYEEKQSSLQEHLRACSLRVNRLAGAGWRVDYILRSSLLQSVEEPMVRLRLEVAAAPDAPAQVVALSLSADKFQVLLAELKQAQTLMSSLG